MKLISLVGAALAVFSLPAYGQDNCVGHIVGETNEHARTLPKARDLFEQTAIGLEAAGK